MLFLNKRLQKSGVNGEVSPTMTVAVNRGFPRQAPNSGAHSAHRTQASVSGMITSEAMLPISTIEATRSGSWL